MPSPSFVLLTNKAVEAKNAHMRRIEQSWYLLAASIAGTLLLGVLTNFIFYLCIKWWGP
jgi:hypothetical protein